MLGHQIPTLPNQNTKAAGDCGKLTRLGDEGTHESSEAMLPIYHQRHSHDNVDHLTSFVSRGAFTLISQSLGDGIHGSTNPIMSIVPKGFQLVTTFDITCGRASHFDLLGQ